MCINIVSFLLRLNAIPTELCLPRYILPCLIWSMQHFQVRMPRQQLNLTPSNSIIAILLRIMQSVHTHRASISLLTISSLPFLYYLFHPKKKKLLLKKLDKLWREFQRFEPRNIRLIMLFVYFHSHKVQH